MSSDSHPWVRPIPQNFGTLRTHKLSIQQWTGDSVVPEGQGQGLPSRGLLLRAGLWTFLQRANISCCEDHVSLRQLLGHFWVKVAAGEWRGCVSIKLFLQNRCWLGLAHLLTV